VDSGTLPEIKCEENRDRSPHYNFLYIRSHESGLNCFLVDFGMASSRYAMCDEFEYRDQFMRIETVLRKV